MKIYLTQEDINTLANGKDIQMFLSNGQTLIIEPTSIEKGN